MRWTTVVAALAMALVGCVAANPSDAFVGSYEGDYSCSGEDQDGAPYEESGEQSILIDQTDDGSTFIAGRGCSIWLDVLSSRQATILESECLTALADGTPVRVIYEGGNVARGASSIAYAYQATVIFTGAGRALYVGCAFEGWRVR